jgi:hypothetical protein
MGILGMLYTCEAIGFLSLNHDPPICSKDQVKRRAEWRSVRATLHWAETDWVHTYTRAENLWTYKNFGGAVEGEIATASSEPLGYDLAEAIRASGVCPGVIFWIWSTNLDCVSLPSKFSLRCLTIYLPFLRAWLDKNGAYKGLSMCEAALIHPKLKKARQHVGLAETFWSHVQCERAKTTFRQMIDPMGDFGSRFHGRWPECILWLDMFSLRQRVCGGFLMLAGTGFLRCIVKVDF